MGFFDAYPQFPAPTYPQRLNGRYEGIIAHNLHRLQGKRVLDIASHDGRWSFAALHAGASYVMGIEPRQDLVDKARNSLAHDALTSDRYDFVCGDVFDVLNGQPFDVVLCLGFLYHTVRHAELIDRIDRTGASFVVIDTEVTPVAEELPPPAGNDPRLVYGNPHGIQLLRDPVDDKFMACQDSLSRNGYTLVGRPSRSAIHFLAKHFGYACTGFDWAAYLENNAEAIPSMRDYHERWRETFFLSK